MANANRGDRRKNARGNGVRGQVVTATTLVGQPVTSVTLAGAILAALERVQRDGGAILEHGVVIIGDDHPSYPGEIVIEAKTDRMTRPPKLGKPLALGGDGDEAA